MPLTVGTRLGPYEVIGVLGAGGMGEVYRAHDTRLQRDVAIKVLPLTDPCTAQPTGGLDVTRDGVVVFSDVRNEGDVMAFSLAGNRTPDTVLGGPGSQSSARVSPDAQWIAYQVTSDGRREVYVEPYPATGARYLLPVSGASDPGWSPKYGSRLFFAQDVLSGSLLITYMAVDVRAGPPFSLGTPLRIAEGGVRVGIWSDDVGTGGRLLILLDATESGDATRARPEIRVTLNWLEELKRLVPTP